MEFRLLTLFLALCMNTAPIAQESVKTGQPILDKVVVTINNKKLDTEVALTARQRFHGLSYRKTLGPDSGMLFVYATEHPLLFTMHGTSIPLSIAFINKDMVINEILPMQPFEEGPFPSRHPARFALEVNQGWFDANGIKVGDTVTLELP